MFDRFRCHLPFTNLGEFEIEKNSMAHGDAGWWMEQFKNADVDSSGNLDFNECKE